MKSYVGSKKHTGVNEVFVINDGYKTFLNPSHIRTFLRKLQIDFHWGDHSVGSNFTSFAILIDCIDPETAFMYFSEFRIHHVSCWQNDFCISAGEVKAFIKQL